MLCNIIWTNNVFGVETSSWKITERRWEVNIKMYLSEVGCEDRRLLELSQNCTQWQWWCWTFRFCQHRVIYFSNGNLWARFQV